MNTPVTATATATTITPIQGFARSYAQGYAQLHAGLGAQGLRVASQGHQGHQGLNYEQHINTKDSFKSIPKCPVRSSVKATAKATAKATVNGIAQGPNQDPDQDPVHSAIAPTQNPEHYSTLLVGPSFCGKTHLLLNKLQLIQLSDAERCAERCSETQIHIFTRSPD